MHTYEFGASADPVPLKTLLRGRLYLLDFLNTH
jgi:hypothetical protein